MRPERRLLALLAACLAPAFLAAALRPAAPALLLAIAMVVLLALLDAWLARRAADLEVARLVPGALALGAWCEVRLMVESRSQRALDVVLYDHHPVTGESLGLPQGVKLRPGETSALAYRFRPHRRGADLFPGVELLVRSPLGLWRLRRWVETRSEVRVFPDFSTFRRYAVLAVENARGPVGIRKRRKRGEGLELHQLREYREGDTLRQIDWKATSRRGQVISRQYDDERNQRVVFLLDCGWRMRAIDDGVAHFDRALNSLLLLTYVAVRQGDAVGLMTIGGEDRWLPPQKGPSAMRSMLEAVHDLETRITQPDFVRAAGVLMVRLPRRALVVILSNLGDEDSEDVTLAARLLRRRHLVLFASLREAALDAAAATPAADFRSALLASAAHHYLDGRRRAHEGLRGRGVTTLDVTPRELPLAIVNCYHEIKRSGAL